MEFAARTLFTRDAKVYMEGLSHSLGRAAQRQTVVMMSSAD